MVSLVLEKLIAVIFSFYRKKPMYYWKIAQLKIFKNRKYDHAKYDYAKPLSEQTPLVSEIDKELIIKYLLCGIFCLFVNISSSEK